VIYWWLDQSLGSIIAVLMVLFFCSALLIFLLSHHSPLSAPIKSCGGLVAPYFGSIGILFGLLTGFLAADISDRNRQAVRAVQSESEALTSMHALSIASVSDMAEIRGKIRAYAQSVVADEWTPAGMTPSPKTEAALTALMQSVADPKLAAESSNAVHSALVNLSLRVAGARTDRLALGIDRSSDLKWISVLFLCLMTQIALGMVHLEKPRAQATALTLFTLAAVIALGLIAEQEAPFDGALQISRSPIDSVLRLAPAPNNPNG